MPAKRRPQFTLHPLLWLSFSFALGIVAARLLQPSFGLLVGIALAFSLAAVLIRKVFVSSFCILAAFFSLGSICYQAELSSVSSTRLSRMYDEGRLVSGDPIEIEGTVVGMPEAAPDGYFIALAAKNLLTGNTDQAVSGKVRIFAPAQTPEAEADYSILDLRHGSRISVACSPEREESYLNPGVMSRIELLDRQGIDATATLKSPLLIEKLGRDRVFLPLAFVYEQRARLIDSIREQFRPTTAEF
jgi:hypothetical protein